MNKIKDFTDKERSEYKTLYSTVADAIYEQREILDEEEVNKRAYVSKIDAIKKYLDKIDEIDYKADKKGFLDIFRSDEYYKNQLLSFKQGIKHEIRFIKKCVTCKCISCKRKCNFEACKNCNLSEIVKACDKSEKCIYHGLPKISLFHHEFNKDINFKILGRLVYKNSEYLLLRNVDNEEDLQLYRYVVESTGVKHYETLTSQEIDEIWDIFVDLGVGR